MSSFRKASISRKTKETSISVKLNLDGSGKAKVDTGIGFLDHMIDQLAFHGLMDVEVSCKGDLHIDGHHTTEDIAIALGQAFAKAIGDKQGIVRYAHAYIPMDETLARVVLDLSGRADFYFDAAFQHPQIGDLDTQLISHFLSPLR